MSEVLNIKKYFSKDSVFLDEDGVRPEWNEASWYLKTLSQGRELLEETCRTCRDHQNGRSDSNEEASGGKTASSEELSFPKAQAKVLYMIKTQFLVNMAGRNKGALTGKNLEEYLELCRECLRLISNDLISAEEAMPQAWRLLRMQWCALTRLKYEGTGVFQIIKDRLYEENQDRKGTGFLPVVVLDLMEVTKEHLHIDFSIDKFVLEKNLSLEVRLNGQALQMREVPRMAGCSFFGKRIADRKAMALDLPIEKLQKKSLIQFVLIDKDGSELTVPAVTVDYQSRVSGYLKQSWWGFGNRMVTLQRNCEGWADALCVERAGKIQKIRQEISLLKEILCAPYGSKQMFLVRCLYWLSCPVYSRKKIWITFDKLYKGGDCGEYFYKYMLTRRKEGITPLYVIRKDAADYERLRKEGLKPSVYRSLTQRLSYLHADMIFATHSSVHSFCGFSKWEIRFLQDRLKAVNTCIQHGLSVQDLTADSHRVLNNNKRYYCASHCEIENLSRPEYDYPEEVLKLTGIPRYDGLVNDDRKQILITPTWRSYIAVQSVMGTARGYNPEFKNTEYYRIFQELLENRTLSETAQKTGYKVIYLLHPVISAQKKDFRTSDGVELVSAMEVSYEELLTQSSLMVTDYSGVQFDFAYMRKPVVYFHPPKLPPHYEDGGFDYETQGFGEICTETEELVQNLCRYMESGCELTEFYRARQDAFFAFSDHENCRRIFEDALGVVQEAVHMC